MLNTNPVTPAFLKVATQTVTTAQTDKTGATSSNLATLYTADTSSTTARSAGQGALLQDVTVTIPSSTSTTSVATVVCIFLNPGGSGTRYLLREIAIAAGTGSTTAAGATSGKIVLNQWLNPGDKVDISTTVTLTVHASANVAEY